MADIKVPMNTLAEVKSDILVTILDNLYSKHKTSGNIKTSETMLSLTKQDQELLDALLPELTERSVVRSLAQRAVEYVPTNTCINFLIVTSQNSDSQNT